MPPKYTGLTVNGITKSYAQWGRETGLSEDVVWARIKVLGWSPERAVSTKSRMAHTPERCRALSEQRMGCANPTWRGGRRAVLDRYYKSTYGISIDEYEKMHLDQRGQCKICLCPSVKGHRLGVDHCHDTGKVRGLLCRQCNWILSQFQEDPERFKRAAQYLIDSKQEANHAVE